MRQENWSTRIKMVPRINAEPNWWKASVLTHPKNAKTINLKQKDNNQMK